MSQSSYPVPTNPGYVTIAGVETVVGAKKFKTADGSTPLRAEGALAQVSEVFVVANDSGTWFFSIGKNGDAFFTTPFSYQPTRATLEVAANGGQTVPLQVWTGNDGYTKASVDPDGSIHSPTVKAYAGRVYARANFR